MIDKLLIGGFERNNFRRTNLVFIPKNMQKQSVRKNQTAQYTLYKEWVYIIFNAGNVLAPGELYARETLGVFTYSWGKPKFGKFIIDFIEILKIQVFF